MVSVDVKHHVYLLRRIEELRNCVKAEVNVPGFPSLIVRTAVSVEVKQHWINVDSLRAQEPCECRGGRSPGLPIPNSSPFGLLDVKQR